MENIGFIIFIISLAAVALSVFGFVIYRSTTQNNHKADEDSRLSKEELAQVKKSEPYKRYCRAFYVLFLGPWFALLIICLIVISSVSVGATTPLHSYSGRIAMFVSATLCFLALKKISDYACRKFWICPHCGESLPYNYRFIKNGGVVSPLYVTNCPHCGQSLIYIACRK